MLSLSTSLPPALAVRLPFYYGWINLLVAALAMVATLPGRTQGLGLITESLLRDVGLDRVAFAQINLWATLLGASACLWFGQLIDRLGSRAILTLLALALGLVVVGMSQVSSFAWLAIAVTLTRALGQSALSVASLSVTPRWFQSRLPMAMAVYTIVLSLGFMIAFPLVGSLVKDHGWRAAWSSLGWSIIVVLAPLAWFLVRHTPESCGLEFEPNKQTRNDPSPAVSFTLLAAARTPAFWVFGLGSALYGLVASGVGLFNESILAERGFPASAYHGVLAVTALTGLIGNFLGGWLMGRWSAGRLMALALGLLASGLFALPHLSSQTGLFMQALVMGLAGGFVSVLFFAVWSQRFGREHLGQIQGAAQMLTVLASALGPLVLAKVVESTGSYALAFRALGFFVLVAALCALGLREAEDEKDPRDHGAVPNKS